jgi:hypothetical protein
MKTNKRILLLGVSLIGIISNINAQSSNGALGNTFVPGRVLGFTGNGANPLLFNSSGANKMMLNGNVSPSINGGLPLNREGFLGLGVNTGFFPNTIGGQGPFSLLHLNGQNAAGAPQNFGYRDWMRFGITSTHNQDLMYIGQRATGGSDVTDAVIGWADNFGSPSPVGPDNMTFNFLTGADQSGNDDLVGTANFGREIMRLTGTGQVGIGPRFNNANQPTSTLHQHQENATSSWMQITNQYMNTAAAIQTGPTAINATNGFRFGILGNNQKIKNGNAYVYNQEERHLIFSTNHTTPTDAQFTNERMRITSISAPTNLTNGGNATFGVWNPGALTNQDVTRVAISHNPATPVTRPLALLHLGYNTGNTLFPLATPTTDGWRPWMDVGTFASEGTDNAYFGLKKETGFNNDRQDAVISWGDNYSPTNQFGLPTGIDKLRIIFTTPEQGQPAAGPGAMSTADGLEFVRYVPFHNASLGVNDPRTGFGDFENLLPVGTINPGNTIEINSIMNGFNAAANTNVTGSYVGSTGASGLRFRDLTSLSIAIPDSIADSLKIDRKKVLTVDSLGNVVLINGGGSGSGLGNICGATPQNPLLNDWEIPTNNFNYRFIAPAGINAWGKNYVGIGTSCAPTANLDVVSRLTSANPLNVIAMNCKQTNLGSNANFTGNGIGLNISVDTTNLNNIGNRSNVRNATNNYAFYGTAITANSGNSNQRNVGVYAEASKAPKNFAMRGRAVSNTGNTSGLTIGGWFSAENSQTRIGVMGDINGAQFTLPTLFPINYAIGVYGWNPSPSSTDYAGYFEGKVNINGALTVYGVAVPSDATLKTNIDSISNATALLKQIEAKSFYYDTTNANGMKFSSQKQYGVIAQQVETILPELISNNYKPAMVDSAGTVINAAKSFKTVNYTAFIGLLIKANQEQQAKIDSLTTKLNSKDSIQDARLAALEAAIDRCCINNTTRNSNTNINQLDVELSDKDAIVLNQNVPNPFAEQTTITYNVPASVGKAQLIFFNTNGQVIQTVDIKTRGKGKVNVFASDLSSGLYNYTLVADGKVIDSKKMVRE